MWIGRGNLTAIEFVCTLLILMGEAERMAKAKRGKAKWRTAWATTSSLLEAESKELSLKNTFVATLTHEIRNFIARYIIPISLVSPPTLASFSKAKLGTKASSLI